MTEGPWQASATVANADRMVAPAARRNRGPIAEILARELPRTGLVLEIASGTGEHALHFAGVFPGWHWQPTDADPLSLRSIAAWRAVAGSDNLHDPLALDVCADDWPVARADAMLCANMVHISPWAATVGLFRGAARVLEPGAPLILYGPFFRADAPTAHSNLAFDRDLRTRNPAWGIRDVADIDAAAAQCGLVRTALDTMPANNLCLTYRWRG